MDLLGAYSDSDTEDLGSARETKVTGPSTVRPLTAATAPLAPRNAAPDPDVQRNAGPAGLFNPFAEEADRQAPTPTATASPYGSKRGFMQVTGSGPLQPAPPKASRTALGPSGPKPAFNMALVPPQLRNGRANVSTEDVERIFSKGTLAKRTPRDAKES